MATLYTADGAPQDVADGDVHDAIASGKLFLPAGQTIHVERPGADGAMHLQAGPSDNVYQAIENGWRVVGPEEVARRQAKKKYGGAAQGAIAGLEGLASGVTLGGSEAAEKGLGLATQEDIEGRKAAHPYVSGAAGVVGAIAPALVGDEISPAGLLATGGAAIEEGIGGGLAGAFARAAAESGVYGGAEEAARQAFSGKPADVSKVLAAAGGDALVGGGFGGILGIAGSVARKAAGFAGPGAAGSIGAETIDDISDALSAKAEADPTTLGEKTLSMFLGPEKAAALRRLSSLDADGKTYRELAHVSKAEAESMFVDGARGLDEVKGALQGRINEIGQVIKPAEIAAGLKNVDPVAARQAAFDKASQEIDARIAAMRAAPETYNDSPLIRRLEVQSSALKKVLGVEIVGMNGVDAAGNPIPVFGLDPGKTPTAEEVFSELDRLRAELHNLGKTGGLVPQADQAAAREIGSLRTETIAPLLADTNVFGAAAAAHARYNELSAKGIALLKDFDREFGTKAKPIAGQARFRTDAGKLKSLFAGAGTAENEGRKSVFMNFLTGVRDLSDLAKDPVLQARLDAMVPKSAELARISKARADLASIGERAGGAAGIFAGALGKAAAGSLLGPVGATFGAAAGAVDLAGEVPAVLHVLDRVVSGQNAKIAALAKSIAKGARRVEGAAPLGIARALDRIRFFDRDYATPSRSPQEAYARRVTEIRSLLADPNRQSSAMRVLKPIADVHPDAAQAIFQQQDHALQVLVQSLPPPAPPDPLDPRPGVPLVSDIERLQFAETARVFKDPMSVMEDLAASRLTASAAATMQSMYPELHAEMAAAVIAAVRAQTKTVPYVTRMQISTFLGKPMDPSLMPASVAASQAAYVAAAAGGAAAGGAAGAAGGMGAPPKLRSTRDLKSIKGAQTAVQRVEASAER